MTQRAWGPRTWLVVRESALWTGAVLGTLGIILAIAHVTAGITPLVVRSGSMEPAIATGAMVITREAPASQVEKGDVVTVRDDQGDRITHRVLAVDAVGGGAYALTLQGDANRVPDPAPYTVTSVDRVLFDVPYAGYAAAFLLSPGAWLLIGSVLVGAYALGLEGGRREKEAEPRQSTSPST